MDSEYFVKVLRDSVLPWLNRVHPNGDCVLYQDGHPAHFSADTMKFIKRHITGRARVLMGRNEKKSHLQVLHRFRPEVDAPSQSPRFEPHRAHVAPSCRSRRRSTADEASRNARNRPKGVEQHFRRFCARTVHVHGPQDDPSPAEKRGNDGLLIDKAIFTQFRAFGALFFCIWFGN